MRGSFVETFGTTDITPTGGGPAICGCGRTQERSAAGTCDWCAAERALNDWSADRPHPLRGVNHHLRQPGPLDGQYSATDPNPIDHSSVDQLRGALEQIGTSFAGLGRGLGAAGAQASAIDPGGWDAFTGPPGDE